MRALLAALLLKYLQWQSRYPWTLSNLVALLRWNLFTHRSLQAWLDDPFGTPADPPEAQPELPLWDSTGTADTP